MSVHPVGWGGGCDEGWGGWEDYKTAVFREGLLVILLSNILVRYFFLLFLLLLD